MSGSGSGTGPRAEHAPSNVSRLGSGSLHVGGERTPKAPPGTRDGLGLKPPPPPPLSSLDALDGDARAVQGPPARSALRYLTEKFLKRSIQQGSHDSVEDARAAMDLAKLKIKHGPGWGVERQETELLVQQLSEAGQRCSLVDRLGSLHKWVTGGASAITVGSDEETVAKVCAEACNQSTDFVWGHLTSLSSLYTARATDRRAAGSRGVVVPVGATALHSSSQSPPDPPGPGTDVAGAAPQAVSDDGHNPYGKQLAEVAPPPGGLLACGCSR